MRKQALVTVGIREDRNAGAEMGRDEKAGISNCGMREDKDARPLMGRDEEAGISNWV